MALDIARRTFITAFCGAAAIWPWTAVAQSGSRRIGVLMAPDAPPYVPFFIEALSKLGWTGDRNVHIDYRKSNADPASLRSAAAELLALRPDVIFAPGLSIVVARTQTQTVPIVFTQTTAPVERGFVASLARPAHCLTKNVTEQVPADDWGGVTESGRCRRWREGSAWARGERWCRW